MFDVLSSREQVYSVLSQPAIYEVHNRVVTPKDAGDGVAPL